MADISEIQLSDNTSYDVEDTPARTIIGVTADSENNISKIKLADNTEYNLKDTQARASIETITTDVKNQVNADKDLINDGVDFIDDETLTDYDDKIAEMQEAYKSFIPINTTSGETVQIDNSTNDKVITSIGLDGNTEQTTYTGKNLFDSSTIVAGDITDGATTIRLSSRQVLWLETGTYTFSTNQTSPLRFVVLIENNGAPPLSTYPTYILDSGWQTSSSYTFTISTAGYCIIGYSKQNNAELTLNDIAGFHYQLEKGSTATTYEPYVGGTASPNPDYPQEVKVVTGANSIEIVGKNLFDKNNANILDNCVTGSTPALQEVEGCKTLYIPCKSNTTYTVSKVASTRFIVCTTDTTPAIGVGTSVRSIDLTGTYITITTGASAKYLCVFYYYSATDTLTEQQILDTIMIEYGSTATTYEAYQSQSYPINLQGKNLANNILGTTDKSAYAPVLTFDADLEPSTTYTISFKGTAGNKIYFNENIFTSNAWNTEILNGVTSVTLTTKDTLDKTALNQRNIYGRWIIVKNVQNQPNNNEWSDVQIEERFDRYFL